MIQHRLLQLVTGILLGLAALSVYTLLRGGTGESRPWDESAIHLDPYPAPELSLETTAGEVFSLDDFRGEVILVFFGFANCPDVCPITLFHWSRALEELGRQDLAFRGVFVTVDPERDTPAELERWMDHFHPAITALTGRTESIDRVTAEWGIHVERRPEDSTGDLVGHVHESPTHDASIPPEVARLHEEHTTSRGPQGDGDPESSEDSADVDHDYMVEHFTRSFVVDREGRVIGMLEPYLDHEALVEILTPLLRR